MFIELIKFFRLNSVYTSLYMIEQNFKKIGLIIKNLTENESLVLAEFIRIYRLNISPKLLQISKNWFHSSNFEVNQKKFRSNWKIFRDLWPDSVIQNSLIMKYFDWNMWIMNKKVEQNKLDQNRNTR